MWVPTQADEEDLYTVVRQRQDQGVADPSLHEWARSYELRQEDALQLAISEAEGPFVVLLSNSQVGSVVRAVGPIIGLVNAEAFSARLAESYEREFQNYTVEWSTRVVPLDMDVARRDREIEWLASQEPLGTTIIAEDEE